MPRSEATCLTGTVGCLLRAAWKYDSNSKSNLRLSASSSSSCSVARASTLAGLAKYGSSCSAGCKSPPGVANDLTLGQSECHGEELHCPHLSAPLKWPPVAALSVMVNVTLCSFYRATIRTEGRSCCPFKSSGSESAVACRPR